MPAYFDRFALSDIINEMPCPLRPLRDQGGYCQLATGNCPLIQFRAQGGIMNLTKCPTNWKLQTAHCPLPPSTASRSGSHLPRLPRKSSQRDCHNYCPEKHLVTQGGGLTDECISCKCTRRQTQQRDSSHVVS